MEEHLETVATVRDLEEAVALIFQHNFDADSRVCLITLMKILDNVLHKPADIKVRTIRLQNDAFHSKVGCRRGALEFLEACGFVRQRDPPPLLSGSEVEGGEERLVLEPERERQSHLITARRLLMTRAIQDLGLKAEELPAYRPPPPPVTATSTSSSSTGTSSASGFNPYAGHRFDAQSAAVGANLGPDANYVSRTETQLQRLQEKQAALEAKMHQQQSNRGWRAWAPNESAVVPSSTSDTTEKRSDSSLLAERMKKQQQERLQREQGGFTTKAMRDLEKLKKQKVYSHVSLTIQFPDGYKLLGNFLPKETVGAVKTALQNDCLTVDTVSFDLYVTPPRRQLSDRNTLQAEGLVPAAKIFVSWKASSPAGLYLQPALFSASSPASAAFPASQPVAASTSDVGTADAKGDESSKKAKTTGESREDALLRRMMGGKSGLSGSKKKGNDGKSSSGKPKWFKS